jgi:hypothetical protein
VELAPDPGDERAAVHLAFQHTMAAASSWPDPARPAQLHLDLTVDPDTDVEQLGAVHLPLDERPDNHVYADPGGHPFCLDRGFDGWGPTGAEQVAAYEAWRAGGS